MVSKGVGAGGAESVHYHGLVHGFPHERYFIELGTLGRFLLGLCFCNSCLTTAQRHGVNAEKVRNDTRLELEHRLASDPGPEEPELVREQVEGFAGGELGRYLESRAETVASLVGEAAPAVADDGARVSLVGNSGA